LSSGVQRSGDALERADPASNVRGRPVAKI